MGLGRKNILVIGLPMVGKSAIMEYLMHMAAQKADVIVLHEAELPQQNVAKMIEQAEMHFQEPPKVKTFKIKRYDIEPLPEPIAFLKSQPKPWVSPPGKGKKYHDKHKFKKRL